MKSDSGLNEIIGSKVPAGIARLPLEQQQALASVLAEAGRRQSRELESTLEEALSYVPALMRGTVRRILFP